ncbi:MAG TPA: hypothetical protein V6C81_18395 [Planktothrix sp.]|jgi:hypothetical protein
MLSRRYELTSEQLPTKEGLKAAGAPFSVERDQYERSFWQNTKKVASAFQSKFLQGTGLELLVLEASYCFFVTGDDEKVRALPEQANGCTAVSTTVDYGMHDNRY